MSNFKGNQGRSEVVWKSSVKFFIDCFPSFVSHRIYALANFATLILFKFKTKATLKKTLRRLNEESAAPAQSLKPGSIVFYSPDAGIEPHFAAHCVLARTLMERGHDVIMARCFELFKRCPVLDLRAAPQQLSDAERREHCLYCMSHSYAHLDAYGIPSFELSSLAIPEIRDILNQSISAMPNDFLEFTFDNVAFGKLTAMDLVLARKVSDLKNLSSENRNRWLQYIETSLMSYLLIDRLCQMKKLKCIVHFNDYGIFLGVRAAAAKHKIPCISVTHASHRSVDRRRYVLIQDTFSQTFFRLREMWPEHRNLALDPMVIHEIGEDIFERFRGRAAHVYSPPRSFGENRLFDKLRLTPGKKLLAAFTSSLDEMLATALTLAGLGCSVPEKSQPFVDQIEWLDAITQWTESRDDVELVVRIHPREGVDKRSKVVSQHLSRLRTHFERSFRNCHFIWPGEPISSYDLGELADVALISWSSIGVELARMGVPVLSSTNFLDSFPHDDFLEWGSTPSAYFAKLAELLSRPPSLETLARSFRWYNLFNLGASLDLGDIVPDSAYENLPSFRLPSEVEAIEQVVMNGGDILVLNQLRLKARQTEGVFEREREGLCRYLRRLVRCIMTGIDDAADYALIVSPAVRARDEVDKAYLSVDGDRVRLRMNNNEWNRKSPLIARIALLCAASK